MTTLISIFFQHSQRESESAEIKGGASGAQRKPSLSKDVVKSDPVQSPHG